MNYDRMQASTNERILSMQNCAMGEPPSLSSFTKVQQALDEAKGLAGDVISLANEIAGPYCGPNDKVAVGLTGGAIGSLPSLATDAAEARQIIADARAAISRIRQQF